MTLPELAENATNLDPNNLVSDSIFETKDLIIKELRDQLYRGDIANEQKQTVHFWYSEKTRIGYLYAQKKRQMNPSADGKVDLKDTGSFYAGMVLKKENDTSFVIDSTDSKFDTLINKYGNNITGLTLDTQEVANKDILINIQKNIREKLGL